jgi:hypothetical protein
VVGRPLGRQATAINEVARLASTSNQHWLVPSKHLQCHVCLTCKIRNVRTGFVCLTKLFLWPPHNENYKTGNKHKFCI